MATINPGGGAALSATAQAVLKNLYYDEVTDSTGSRVQFDTTLDKGITFENSLAIKSAADTVVLENKETKAHSYPAAARLLDHSIPENRTSIGAQRVASPDFGELIDDGSGGFEPRGPAASSGSVEFNLNTTLGVSIAIYEITVIVAEEIAPTDKLYYAITKADTNKIVYKQELETQNVAIGGDFTWLFNNTSNLLTGSVLNVTMLIDKGNTGLVANRRPLLVCPSASQPTEIYAKLFGRAYERKELAYKSEVEAISSGTQYKAGYDANTNTPDLTSGGGVVAGLTTGDFYKVTVDGTQDLGFGSSDFNVGDTLIRNGSSWDYYPTNNATIAEIEGAALTEYDLVVDSTYSGTTSTGSSLRPFKTIQAAIATAVDDTSILVKGNFLVTEEIVLPNDKSLHFYGKNGATVKYDTYATTNGNIFYGDALNNTKEYTFKGLDIKNAGGYGVLIKNAKKVTIENNVFMYNGWNGTELNTVLPSTMSGLLGYDSSQAELQAFYAGSNASNGGAVRLENCTTTNAINNDVSKNLRGIRLQDCGVNGSGFVTRNVVSQNIESGIYLAAGTTYYGCQNIVVAINASSYNANNGILCIGGLNNKLSQNEVNGNWNAAACGWGTGNWTVRDMGFYDNNRSQFNGIGNTGDAKASIQLNEAYNLLGTQISLNPAARFIAEILDTQVHYTGLGSNTDRTGFLITSGVGQLPDNDKNIIKIDDVGFIGQDYAIDFSECDLTNLRVSLGDNSYQSIGVKAVKAPLAGNYSELPFSNHVMQVPEVDVVVDTLKQTIALHEGVGGNVINVYKVNELQSLDMTTHIDIIQKSSDKIQLRGLTLGNVYINGFAVGTNVSSMNDSLNAAFEMSLVEYKEFLTSEVGINEGTGSGGSLPAIANNWYVSYGSQAGTQVNSATIGNSFRNYNPFYNGEALEKGHEFIWTINATVDYMIGIWGAAEGIYSGADAIQSSNWTVGFGYDSNNNRFSTPDSSGVTIEQGGDFAGMYGIPNGQVALRFGQDGYLYLFEVVGGGYTLIGKSNSTITGTSVMIQFGAYNEASFPVMTERTETWEIVHDFDNSENSEWSDGIDDGTILRSRTTLNSGQKIVLSLNHFGRGEHIGFGYSGASSGVANAENQIDDHFFYNQSELLKGDANNGGSWTFNEEAIGYYDPIGDGSNIGYWNGSGVNLGEIAIRYTEGNAIKLFHETNNELIATLNSTKDGSPINIYFGAAENNHPANRIPVLNKFNLVENGNGDSTASQTWFYIESPNGEFYYPLFLSAAEANAVDIIEGGTGTSHTHTFVDELPTSRTWYMPDTSGVHAGSTAPQHGVFGNSTNVLWNEQETGVDSSFAPTFTDITYTVQEGSAVNIQYKPQGDTNTYNLSALPTGYADNGNSIIGTAETILDATDIQHVITVTKANDYGSVVGYITINVTNDVANDIAGTSIASSSTPFTKIMTFDGSNDGLRNYSSSSGYNVMNFHSSYAPSSVTVGKTATQGNPYMFNIWFRKTDTNTSSEESIIGYGQSQYAHANRVELYMKNGKLHLLRGNNSNNILWTSDLTIQQNVWYNFTVVFNGGDTGSGSASVNDYYSRYTIYQTSVAGAVTDITSDGTWTNSNYGNNVGMASGRLYIGFRHYGYNPAQIDVASASAVTLNLDTNLPDSTEISMFANDPKGYETTYLAGNVRRLCNQYTSNGSYTYQVDTNNTYTSNVIVFQSYWMGDGQQGSEAFNNIRNQALWYGYTNNYRMTTYNMSSSDLINGTPS